MNTTKRLTFPEFKLLCYIQIKLTRFITNPATAINQIMGNLEATWNRNALQGKCV